MGSSETLIHLVKDLPEIELARAVLATVREPLMILDGQMRIKWANESFYTNFRLEPEQTEDCLIYELDGGRWDIREVRDLIDKNILERNVKEAGVCCL
jgi:PAS domain-containing protein